MIKVNISATAALLLIFALYLSDSRGATSVHELTIVYTGGLNGELEPCGCAEESDVGGIRRRATVIDQLRQHNENMILISGGGLISSNSWQDKIKAGYIFSAIKMMAYDSVSVQWRDLAFGEGFTQSGNIPWVTSNWAGNGFEKVQSIERGDTVISVFSWLDDDTAPETEPNRLAATVAKSPIAFNQKLLQAKQRGEVTILTTTADISKVEQNISLSHVDILLLPSSNEKYEDPRFVNETLVLNYGTRGMRVGKLTIEIDGGVILNTIQHEVFTLDNSVNDSPHFDSWYEQYNNEARNQYYARLEFNQAESSGVSKFVGASGCAGCHEKEHAIWSNSNHAAAFKVLQLVSKQFDPSCIGCHSVGFEKPGGFIDMSATEHLANVQCESCHGPARDHFSSGGIQATSNSALSSQQICQQCHVGDHSPKFEFENYWPRIAH
ncbi:MAG: hypothetical protein COA78_04075 [Blastopirellula sp.]|nr:MAG: hypothetical protein COA78_04075 [Blastopirellula sp.]